MKLLSPSLSLRKAILDERRKNNPQWKSRMLVVWILRVAALVVLAFFITFPIVLDEDLAGIAVFAATGFIFAFVFFIISVSLNNSSKYNCALPYSIFANASLILYEDHLEYIFWIVGEVDKGAYSNPNQKYYDEIKLIYSIKKEDIESIEFKDSVCYIKGNGDLSIPEYFTEMFSKKRICKELFPDLLKKNTFSFILAFEEDNPKQVILDWYKQK